MSSVSVPLELQHEATPARGAFPMAALSLLALAPALLSTTRVNILECGVATGLLALVALYFFLQHRLSPAASGLALALLYFATLVNLSPLALRGTLQQGWTGSTSLRWAAQFAPLGCVLLMAVFAAGRPVPSDRAGQYLHSLAFRFHLWLVSCLALAGGLLLGGYSIRNAPALAPLLAAGVLALRPVHAVSTHRSAAALLCAGMALVLAVNIASGIHAWAGLGELIARGSAAVTARNSSEAATVLNDALRANERVQSRSRQLETLRQLGILYEQMGEFQTSLHYWRLVAEMTGVEFGKHPAVRRILVRQGDSLLGWRQLIYQGFPSVMSDELTPGFMALAERPDSDVRGTLMAALIGWERGEPESLRRELLERVLAKRANEVSANTLLSTLGRPLPKESLWLGEDLIMGTQPTHHSLNGAILDLGTVESLVFLTEGQWECRVQARGTPLNEEWPILRVEIDGVEALRTRVNKAEPMQLPFTFEIKRRNLYRIRFIFENRLQMFQSTQKAFRTLNIDGVHFQRAQ